MFTLSKIRRDIALKAIYETLDLRIGDSATKGAMYIYLEPGDELTTIILNHPAKTQVFNELEKSGYGVYQSVGGGIKIGWAI